MPGITPLPPAPSSADPENFAALADAFVAALVQFATELNVIIGTTIPAGSAAANTLTGSTLAANVLASSLTSLGALSTLQVNGAVTLGDNAADVLLMTTNAMKVVASGQVTFPLQAAFLAYNQGDDTNATGDGTNYAVICDGEVFDQGGDYNTTTGVYTARVTGRHLLRGQVLAAALGAGHATIEMRINTSNRVYRCVESFGGGANPNISKTLGIAVVADMDAGDIAYPSELVSGSTLSVTVAGGSDMFTFFSGALIA